MFTFSLSENQIIPSEGYTKGKKKGGGWEDNGGIGNSVRTRIRSRSTGTRGSDGQIESAEAERNSNRPNHGLLGGGGPKRGLIRRKNDVAAVDKAPLDSFEGDFRDCSGI
ncbi:hypothetical protein CEXT_738721 [Caerostris extrusa]|uniref:Uncharacterized protein n=1 Tax=Caerostris extrusa TaxID=172846 RepID=A0AAV4PLE1_CAEEX|nr:hypothetical protein CEXT_738721 [Caerostris extrusa]